MSILTFIGASLPTVLDQLQTDLRTDRWASQPPGATGSLGPSEAPSPGPNGEATKTPEGQILIVDDEPDMRRMLRGLLEDEGYTVGEAIDGVEGLAYLRASSRRLVVLLDYKMPRMNGGEMLQAVLADPQIAGRHAFVFVTANLPAFSPGLLQLLHTTAIPLVQKPFEFLALLDEIERAIVRLQSTPDTPAP